MADPILLNAVPFYSGAPSGLTGNTPAYNLLGGNIETGDAKENVIQNIPIGALAYALFTDSGFYTNLVTSGAGAPVGGTNTGLFYYDTSASNKLYVSPDGGATWLAVSM